MFSRSKEVNAPQWGLQGIQNRFLYTDLPVAGNSTERSLILHTAQEIETEHSILLSSNEKKNLHCFNEEWGRLQALNSLDDNVGKYGRKSCR